MILHAEKAFHLVAIIETATKMTGVPYIGFLPVTEGYYSFTTDEICLMRKIVEEVYDMPGLKAYYEKFTYTTRPDLANHPSKGRWTLQAEYRLIRLLARCRLKVPKTSRMMRIDWKKVESFTTQYPALLPDFHLSQYSGRLHRICKNETDDMSVKSFLEIMQHLDEENEFPEDVLFDRAINEFSAPSE